ncbi:MAG: DUF711 family protein [Candidatus Methanofastidiosia archaeon]|jgi:uncharacterized protein (UPF0210 family)
MRIRTITTGFNLTIPFEKSQLKKIAAFTTNTKEIFENKGYTVQTTRITTQPWEEYFKSEEQLITIIKNLEEFTHNYGIDYFNVGTTVKPENMPFVYDIVKNTSNGFCTTTVCNGEINYEAAKKTAAVIKKLSTIDKDGFANLRFAALFNTGPGTPFYPASYHRGPPSFALGTENSDVVYKAFLKAKNVEKARFHLKNMLTKEYMRIQEISEEISKKENMAYTGVDVSVSPSVLPEESIAFAFEKLGLGTFGKAGTVAIAAIVTDILTHVPIKKCGYSGLMLPVLEDYGLALRNNEGAYNVQNLLLYSAVCGTGLDTIPLPGDVSEKKLYALLLDIASLSTALKKPLSARLMPIPGKKSGEITEFTFEYFANSRIMKL